MGQLIEYKIRNIFLEKSYSKYDEKTNPRPFSKKSKLSIFLDQLFKVLHDLYLLYVQVEGYRKILKLRCTPPAFTSYKSVLNMKKWSGTSLPASFSAWFLKKNISKFHCLIAFTSRNVGQYVYCNCLLTRLWHHKIWISFRSFLVQSFPHITKKSGQKFKNEEIF